MAARKTAGKSPRGKARAANPGGGLGRALVLGAALLGGMAMGYGWRSYYPVALPFESRLTSDKLSTDIQSADLREVARAANDRAAKAERELAEARQRVKDLERDRQLAEREIGDMQIKSILNASD